MREKDATWPNPPEDQFATGWSAPQGRERRSLAAILTRSAESAFILSITLSRCAFTLISQMPSSLPTCLFNKSETTSDITDVQGRYPYGRGKVNQSRDAPSGAKCCLEGALQSGITERLKQTFDRPLLKQAGPYSLISLPCDEDDRNLPLPQLQFVQKLWPRHARHRNVEDQTPCLSYSPRRKKVLCGRKDANCKTERLQQIWQRLPYRLVVIDY